jgi:hypothetical protein
MPMRFVVAAEVNVAVLPLFDTVTAPETPGRLVVPPFPSNRVFGNVMP